MRLGTSDKEKLRALITEKTYPIPSSYYDELFCTAGITEDGEFVRLYPIDLRDLSFSQHRKKYEWINVVASNHQGAIPEGSGIDRTAFRSGHSEKSSRPTLTNHARPL